MGVLGNNFCLLDFLHYGLAEVRVLTNLIYFSFGLADDQKSFNAACNHYELYDYCKMISFLSSNNTLGRVSTFQISSLLDVYFK